MQLLRALLDPSRGALCPSDIGVITPYAAQVQLISEALRSAGMATSSSAVASGSDGSMDGGGVVEVASVDGYQGREKEVIVFRCVCVGGGHGAVRRFTQDPGTYTTIYPIPYSIWGRDCSLFTDGRQVGHIAQHKHWQYVEEQAQLVAAP